MTVLSFICLSNYKIIFTLNQQISPILIITFHLNSRTFMLHTYLGIILHNNLNLFEDKSTTFNLN